MNTPSKLEQGRQAYSRQEWSEALECLSESDREHPMEPEDLDLLARAAYLTGKDTRCFDIWARAHQGFLSRSDSNRAIRCAFWLGFLLIMKGEKARGGGWIARARRLLEENSGDCAERGLLLLPVGLGRLGSGDAAGAYDTFSQAVEIGKRHNDVDLLTLGRLGRGQSLILQNRIEEGVSLLDEAMVDVESDEVSPIAAGIVYCAVIETCQKIYDLRRAQEWTKALNRWCESQPDLFPYRSHCLVHRAEIMRFHGSWPDAMQEAKRACEQRSESHGESVAGAGYYQQAELHRLRGEFSQAEEAYRMANKWGRKSQPGLALLRLAEGQPDAAKAAISRVLDETQNPVTRSRLLPAYIAIMIETGDTELARNAADELSAMASESSAPFLHATASHMQGAVLLAEDETRKALGYLRQSWKGWEELEAPYYAARLRVLIGLACRKLGDEDAADMELDAAGEIFEQLGAQPDLNRVESLSRKTRSGGTHGLTPRELQVLRRMSTGKTNKDIAGELFISERTVDRHVSNILSKLNVPTRTAATAYAFEHELV